MKKLKILLLFSFVLGLAACGKQKDDAKQPENNKTEQSKPVDDEQAEADDGIVNIKLSNSSILVEGEEITENPEEAVYKANDIIFYLADQGITYGEGEAEDEHSQNEADAHTVVHITEPGTYEISGKMEAGQIFVDLGEDAKDDENAVVNLILNNADITCTVAPAILFYQVYECSDKDAETATMDIDIRDAGANLILADGSANNIYGSYVAKIYKSCELNEEGTEVVDSKKLHKYDAAVYSKMSMNISGNDGILNIKAENEGLDTELHLAIHGGEINIASGNDGINVNEDGVSVFEMNDGVLNITVTGESGEGDGIDSNGWLLVNGGIINAFSCETSMDAGVDADNGIYVYGGTVVAGGNMHAEISDGTQEVVNFYITKPYNMEKDLEVRDMDGNVLCELKASNMVKMLVVSLDVFEKEKAYEIWQGEELISQIAEGNMDEFPMKPEEFPEGERTEKFPEKERPNGAPDRERPEGLPGGKFSDKEIPDWVVQGEEMQRPVEE